MVKSAAERNRDKEARKRAAGQREIRVWVPDDIDCITEVRELAVKLCAERTKIETP